VFNREDFMKKKSYAKINLTLDVIEKREDGYHNIDGIMQLIDLYDEVEVNISDHFEITSNSKDIPLDENNLVYKAYIALKEKYKSEALGEKTLVKSIVRFFSFSNIFFFFK